MDRFTPHQNAFNQDSLRVADDFRLLLEAMARPGKVFEVAARKHEAGTLKAGAATTLLALSDHETPVWLDQSLAHEDVLDFLRFHCGCPLVDETNKAMFAVAPSSSAAFTQGAFALGTAAYPDRSTTLIVQVESLGDDGSYVLSGPGIRSTQSFHVEGLSRSFWDWRAENNKSFPLGTDLILVSDKQLAALPRTTRVREFA